MTMRPVPAAPRMALRLAPTRTSLGLLVVCALALVPPVSMALGQDYYIDMFTRVVIFAIAAVSLDLILGFGGLVSFCHASFLAVGAYAVAILAFHGVQNGWVQFATAILAGGFVACLVGAVSLRTSGMYFIMITLAFGQMLYFLGIRVQEYGGDSGLTINAPPQFGMGLDLGVPVVLFYVCLFVLLATLLLLGRVADSRFGMVLQGMRMNETRMGAIGLSPYRYRLAAFTLAGAVCGLAGALMATQALFVSPALAQWARSGELMVMVILGGGGTLVGPVLGAIAYLGLEEFLSGITDNWQIVLGAILLGFVLFARGGLARLRR